LEDINVVRARVKLPGLTLAKLTLAAILKERELDLAFEGQKLWDIKRTKGSIGSLPWNSPTLIYPIPQREIIANPNLTQN
jgi:starch-binding outer membrane protein, SusD/RagB family